MQNFLDLGSINQQLLNLIDKDHAQAQKEDHKKQSNTLAIKQMPWDLQRVRSNQYHYLYTNRLQRLRKRVIQKITKDLFQISEVEGKSGVIKLVGMLKRIQNNRKRAFQKSYKNYYENATIIYNEEDLLELEDSSGRIIIQFQNGKAKFNNKYIKQTQIPHGVVIGVSGKHNEKKNVFYVQQIILPQAPVQNDFIVKDVIQNKSSRKVLIMSEPTIQQIQRTFQFIACASNQFLSLHKQIKSIIIMGCSDNLDAFTLKKLDESITEIKQYIDIMLLPSGNTLFPERSYHPIMFRQNYDEIGLCSNPQILTSQNGLEMLLFSGQNIKDLIKNCEYGECSLDILELILSYGHMSPCSPFSLKSQMTPEDYLILESMPHIVVSGQCQNFSHRIFEKESKKVLMVSLPHEGSVLVDIDSLEIQQFNKIE